MSTITITTPASTLRLSPLRVEDLLQGAIMVIWINDRMEGANTMIGTKFLQFDVLLSKTYTLLATEGIDQPKTNTSIQGLQTSPLPPPRARDPEVGR